MALMKGENVSNLGPTDIAQVRVAEDPEVMIDIETLDTGPRSVVLSIGAVSFSQSIGAISEIYAQLEFQPQIIMGRTISESTLRWWMGQDRTARSHAFAEPWEHLNLALVRVSNWLKGHTRYWAKGPSFDITIMESLFDECGIARPWGHREQRDVRTVVDVARLPSDWKPDLSVQGVAHDPVYDCHWQIEMVREARRRIMVLDK